MELPTSNVLMRHRNPGASMDLVIPVHIVCNTPDEVLIDNITANSRLPKVWLKASDEHEGIAILCGSGPSIADDVEAIREHQLNGGVVFAMNGCASFLGKRGITPDYQVICDARKDNVALIGPAKQHLFASQCHPAMFDAVPDAVLWHLQIGEIENYFPEYSMPYVLIGGAASVGNTALCLAYAMGFRELHLYGYDSCHKDGHGHAFHQALNEGDPTCITKFNGKEYLASLTMKHQAEKFQETARALEEMGTAIHVHGSGLLPDMWNAEKVYMSEEEKYQLMWGIDGYRKVSPGELVVDTFLDVVKPTVGARIADFGCGTGRGGLAISKVVKCSMTLVDFTENSRDEEARSLPFIKADLSAENGLPLMVRHGYCCDVMEHIPPELVDRTITNIMGACSDCFFQISTVPDVMGAEIGQQLHLTVRPHNWWRSKFESLGYKVTWEEKQDIASLFHISLTGDPQ